jgi:hypothetical protein
MGAARHPELGMTSMIHPADTTVCQKFPADSMTALLADGWRAVLGHDDFDERTDFFRTGGHSLRAAHLTAWLEPRLGHRPPMRLFFRHPVLADQVGALAAAPSATTTPSTES